jgi:hypothetical protein
MHSSFNLVPGILKAFESTSPHLLDFLDARLKKSKHLECRELFQKAIKEEKALYFEDG